MFEENKDIEALACRTVNVMREQVLTGPEKWTQGTFARNSFGHACDVFAEGAEAQSFCLLGAYYKAREIVDRGHHHWDIWNQVEQWLTKRVLDKVSILPVSWNDRPSRTFGEVAALLDEIRSEAPCSKPL
jgi:hypothetical protein